MVADANVEGKPPRFQDVWDYLHGIISLVAMAFCKSQQGFADLFRADSSGEAKDLAVFSTQNINPVLPGKNSLTNSN